MKARKYLSDVTISLDLARSVGDLYPIYKSERDGTGFSRLCPGCSTPNLVMQRYTCSENHGPYEPSQVTGRGKLVNNMIIPVDPNEIPTEEKTLEMILNVHPVEQITTSTRPNGKAYRFVPQALNDPFYGVMCDLVQEPDLAFVAKFTIRGVSNLFQLNGGAQGLILTGICHPEMVYETDPIPSEYDSRYLKMALDIASSKLTDFDPSEHANTRTAFINNVISAGTEVKLLNNPRGELPDIELMLLKSLERMGR